MNSALASKLFLDLIWLGISEWLVFVGLFVFMLIIVGGFWWLIFEMESLVAAHAQNLSEGSAPDFERVTYERLFPKRSIGQHIWFWAMFISGWVMSYVLTTRFHPTRLGDYVAGMSFFFFFISIFFIVIEYVRLMVARKGVLYALFDLAAWFTIFAVAGLILGLITSTGRRLLSTVWEFLKSLIG